MYLLNHEYTYNGEMELAGNALCDVILAYKDK